jgi:hypothetical protein
MRSAMEDFLSTDLKSHMFLRRTDDHTVHIDFSEVDAALRDIKFQTAERRRAAVQKTKTACKIVNKRDTVDVLGADSISDDSILVDRGVKIIKLINSQDSERAHQFIKEVKELSDIFPSDCEITDSARIEYEDGFGLNHSSSNVEYTIAYESRSDLNRALAVRFEENSFNYNSMPRETLPLNKCKEPVESPEIIEEKQIEELQNFKSWRKKIMQELNLTS